MKRLRIAGLARAVGRGARVVLDKVPPTALGLLLTGAAALAFFHYGRQRQDLVLYVAGLGVGVLVLVAQLLVGVTTAALMIALGRSRRGAAAGSTGAAGGGRARERLDAGTPIMTGFSLPGLGWLPLVSVRWQWREPAGVQVEITPRNGRLVEEVTFAERGEHERVVRRILVEDVFGLARLGFRVVEATPHVVLPARGRPLAAPILEAMAGGDAVSHPLGPPDGDLVEMRRYVAGDPMKRILWKTFARSRTLMVRLPERAYAPTRRTLAFLVAAAGDEPPAGVARLALETGAFGPDWRFGADGAAEPARTVAEAMEQVVRSQGARDRGGAGLGPFLEAAADAGSYRCVLFVPARPGPWLEAVERSIKLQTGTVDAIVCSDGVVEETGAARWRRLVLRPDAAEARADVVRARDIEEVSRRLVAAGARVSVLDRRTGRFQGRTNRRRAA